MKHIGAKIELQSNIEPNAKIRIQTVVERNNKIATQFFEIKINDNGIGELFDGPRLTWVLQKRYQNVPIELGTRG